MRLFIIFSLFFIGFNIHALAQIEQDTTVVIDSMRTDSTVVNQNMSQPASAVDLHLNLSVGDRYLYSTDYTQNIVQEIMGSSIEIRQQMTTDYQYEVESNTGDEIKIKATYQRLQVNLEAPQGSFNFDSDNPQQEERLKKLSDIIDKPFFIYMNSEGKVTKVEDHDKVLAGLELDHTIGRLLSDSVLSNSVDMNIYAPHPVNMGESWNKTRSYDLGKLQLKSEQTYTLEGMSEDLVWLNVSGDIAAVGTEESYDMEFSGSQNGTLETDLNTGMISYGEINMDVDAVIKSQGFEIPMTMNANIKMSGSKL